MMTRLGLTLGDVPERLSWDALHSFVGHLGEGSALHASMHPDEAQWCSGLKTNILLADIYDAISAMRYQHACSCTPRGRRRPAPPEPYPRFWSKKPRGEKRYGSKPIPIARFDEWWNSKGGD